MAQEFTVGADRVLTLCCNHHIRMGITREGEVSLVGTYDKTRQVSSF